MPLKQLAYIPNHVSLTRAVINERLIKPTKKVKQPSTIQLKLSGKHADELLAFKSTGFPSFSANSRTQLYGFALTINEEGCGSSVLGQL